MVRLQTPQQATQCTCTHLGNVVGSKRLAESAKLFDRVGQGAILDVSVVCVLCWVVHIVLVEAALTCLGMLRTLG